MLHIFKYSKVRKSFGNMTIVVIERRVGSLILNKNSLEKFLVINFLSN